MPLLHAYISSIRPATLLLAAACAISGAALAIFSGAFSVIVFLLTTATALLLQVLSNLANDYGDFQKGTDDLKSRVGPTRALLRGEITMRQLKGMIILTVIAIIAAGLLLLYFALNRATDRGDLLTFLVLGALAIWAAIKYTAGKNPYGYRGLGDLFTFIFFGPIGFVGAYFLQTHKVDFIPWLPSIGFGILTILVINVNNMRDLEYDKAAGKTTIPIRLGKQGAKHYHGLLTALSFLCYLGFSLLYSTLWYHYLYLLMFIPLMLLVVKIYRTDEGSKLAPYLKQTVILAFITAVAFSICINL